MSETLALHIAKAAELNQGKFINVLFEQLVERTDDILSIALVRDDKNIGYKYGDHKNLWEKKPLDKASTPSHIQVPILRGQEEWGILQLRFVELPGTGIDGVLKNNFILLLLFIDHPVLSFEVP